jgi:hypothetical protein
LGVGHTGVIGSSVSVMGEADVGQDNSDVDPVPGSVRHAVPPLAPPLDRTVQPVAAAGIVCAVLVLWWLRKKYISYRMTV